ncbi:hypothetical protein BJ165DRAFT_1411033 [Panaeolus papilionaceus]|nr:hypothetical protein BJ165DRAFT_1411033 [Panaeolus papilionaceus]
MEVISSVQAVYALLTRSISGDILPSPRCIDVFCDDAGRVRRWIQTLKTAIEAARMLLRVDDVVQAIRKEKEGGEVGWVKKIGAGCEEKGEKSVWAGREGKKSGWAGKDGKGRGKTKNTCCREFW